MSEDDAQKFHIGEVSFPSDKSSVWNFSAHSLDIISQGNCWWCCKMLAVFSAYV